jgi:hypothetical protein
MISVLLLDAVGHLPLVPLPFHLFGADDLRSFEIVETGDQSVVLDDEFVGSRDGGAQEVALVALPRRHLLLRTLESLRVHRLVELHAAIRLGFNLGRGVVTLVCNLKEEHGVGVEGVEEDEDVDDEGQQVLDGRPRVALVDLVFVYFGADEDKLHHDEGGQVDDAAGIVVEEEQFGLVHHLPSLHQPLMPALYHILPCSKMLRKHLTVVIFLVCLLREIRDLNRQHIRLLLIVDFEQLDLLECLLGLVLLTLPARDKAVTVGFDHRHYDDFDHRDEDDAQSREDLAV